MTQILSLSFIVLRRWAMTSAEPRRPKASKASCTLASFSLSSAEVASSRRITSGLRIIALAMARRWRCPPERFFPPSLIIEFRPSGFSVMKV
mmetsp:Transcript_29671/g.66525  ORF Transcript_29671/g.66525 Transcript_29671/m.66525 type:complete len:92 (-) Transcript_29671:582-857(-)